MPAATTAADGEAEAGGDNGDSMQELAAGAAVGADAVARVHTTIIYVPDVWHAQPTQQDFDAARMAVANELAKRQEQLDADAAATRAADDKQLDEQRAIVTAAQERVQQAEQALQQVPMRVSHNTRAAVRVYFLVHCRVLSRYGRRARAPAAHLPA